MTEADVVAVLGALGALVGWIGVKVSSEARAKEPVPVRIRNRSSNHRR